MTKTIPFPLTCTKQNPQFCSLLDEITHLIQTCTYLLNKNKFPKACLLFSNTINTYIAHLPHTNLDAIHYEDIFHGEYALELSNIFKELIELWKRIQEDQVAEITGAKAEFNLNIFKLKLKKIEKKLEELTLNL